MALAPNVTQSQCQTVLRSFLLSILPSGVEVIEGQDNKVPEPLGSDFVVITSMRRRRIETNFDTYGDARFTASINGNALTVSALSLGTIALGASLFGVGVSSGITIASQSSGPVGGPGAYVTAGPALTLPSQTMAAGQEFILQPVEITFQLDVHSSSISSSADMAQTISTVLRDSLAFEYFEQQGVDVVPLHADDPKQLPFMNAENQYETRWVVEACLQANQYVTPSLQFADSVVVVSRSAQSYPV